MKDELHISSLVVQVLPSEARRVQDAIARLRGAEISATTMEGRVVVTLETSSEAEFLMRFREIDRVPGVVSTMLVFHQVENVAPG